MEVGEIVILGAARTPIGRYGGSLKDTHPAELGAVAARAALQRAGIPVEAVEEVVIGHGRQAGSGPNPGRQVAHRAGVPVTAPAQTINKACASGLQAIAAGAQSLLGGESAVVVAGGIESMSRMPYLVDAIDARWGHKMGHFQFVDAMYRDGFADPAVGAHHGRDRRGAGPPVRHHPRRVRRLRPRESAQGRSRADARAASTPRSHRWR